MNANKSSPPCDDRQRLLPSLADRVAGWILACLVLVGTINMGLLVIWFSTTFQSTEQDEKPEGGEIYAVNLNEPDSQPMAQPTFGELPDISLEPQLADLDLLPIIQDLSTTIVGTRETGSELLGDKYDFGPMDGFDRTPGEPFLDIIPHWQRWELRFDTTNLANYARQLDAFDIELAAIGGGVAWVDYANQLTTTTPDHRKGNSRDEKRIYMSWINGNLARFDRQLLAAAGIPTGRRIIVHFLPDELTQTLKTLEAEDTERPEKEWHTTVFALRKTRDVYRWYVVSRTFR